MNEKEHGDPTDTLQAGPSENPPKVDPAAGVAVRVIVVPAANKATQKPSEQEMPAGLLVIVPLPSPSLFTLRVKVARVNVAVTLFAASIVTVHCLGLPASGAHPLQPTNVEVAFSAAVSVTTVLIGYVPAQSLAHAVPLVVPVTVPVPVPDLLTVRANALSVKVAVTVCACVSVTVQSPVAFRHAPLQPVKIEFASALAVSVTTVPLAYNSVQSAPQVIPVGPLITVPVPVPDLTTDKEKVVSVGG